MIPSETELHHFIEIYHARNISRASDSLRISQSAVTQSLSKLEAKTGVKLFYRTKTGCIPTPGGEIFYKEARELLGHWQRLQEGLKQDQSSVVGQFRFGIHPALASYALPDLMRTLYFTSPGITLNLVHDYSKHLVGKVLSFEVDLALVVNPAREKDLVMKKIFEDRICIWTAKKITDIPKILFTDMNSSELKSFLKRKHSFFHDWKIIETTSLELIRSLVEQGAGLGILPERVASQEKGTMKIFDESMPVLKDEIYLIYRHDVLKSHSGKNLLTILGKLWRP